MDRNMFLLLGCFSKAINNVSGYQICIKDSQYLVHMLNELQLVSSQRSSVAEGQKDKILRVRLSL